MRLFFIFTLMGPLVAPYLSVCQIHHQRILASPPTPGEKLEAMPLAAATTRRPLPVLPRLPAAHLELRLLRAGPEVDACAALEAASYPADEAASPERLAERQRDAGVFFWALFDKTAEAAGKSPQDGTLMGFICGTCAHGVSLTHESMEQHVPGGQLLCVHSVVVRSDIQRCGVALAMLREYLRAVASLKAGASAEAAPRTCALIAKAGLVSLYVKAGFELVGLSSVVHGVDPWFELKVPDIARAAAAEPLLRCDAFTATPCAGNQAAVVFSHRNGDAAWMQKVAMENNLSETAFVEKLRDEDSPDQAVPSKYAIRWFTPSCEVDLCGHATLGAAHGLWATGRVAKRRRIDFSTKASGMLSCSQTDRGWIEMDFPADPPAMAGEDGAPAVLPSAASFAKALGLESPSSVVAVGRGRFDLLCELTEAAFDSIRPDQAALAAFDCRGIVVTAKGCEGSRDAERAAAEAAAAAGSGCAASAEIDFRSRFFGPKVGCAEDPVTGSAHCMLAPYWAKRLGRSAESAVLLGFQASARGGIVHCRLQGASRLIISGPCVTTLEGTLHCN